MLAGVRSNSSRRFNLRSAPMHFGLPKGTLPSAGRPALALLTSSHPCRPYRHHGCGRPSPYDLEALSRSAMADSGDGAAKVVFFSLITHPPSAGRSSGPDRPEGDGSREFVRSEILRPGPVELDVNGPICIGRKYCWATFTPAYRSAGSFTPIHGFCSAPHNFPIWSDAYLYVPIRIGTGCVGPDSPAPSVGRLGGVQHAGDRSGFL